MKTSSFTPGLQLAEGFFLDVVEPRLAASFPKLRYSAALIGGGSEVLGFDTAMSADHHWGPRAMIFLRPADYRTGRRKLISYFQNNLPPSYRKYPTNFSEPDPLAHGHRALRPAAGGAANHRIVFFTIDGFFKDYLNVSISEKFRPIDWLTLPFQKLRSIVSGKVFHDDLGLEKIRRRFSWYPDDVWRYILASAWTRIGQEEHLMGRAGSVHDELGSALIAARLVRDLMRLSFLMERSYPPYAKWLGTAFSRLSCGPRLKPILSAILLSPTWPEREAGFASAYRHLIKIHNALKITGPLPTRMSQFWGRPFRVMGGDKIADEIGRSIKGRAMRDLARDRPIGNFDLISDNTDFHEDPTLRYKIRNLYT